ncbi:hypothetical protein BKA70DRAFT_1116530, partial [Coprinopsis sp. MPI-PUGE-AT-0042]
KPFQILELGAGTGLVSLAIALFYHALLNSGPHPSQFGCQRRGMEIIATDYYSSVLENLAVNLKSNGFGSAPKETNAVVSTSNHPLSNVLKVSLKSCSLDWSTFSSPADYAPASSCSSPLPPLPTSSNDFPLDQMFDMAFGADIVYKEQHAVWIKGCLKKLLRRPLGATTSIGGDEREDKDPNTYFHLIIPLCSTHTFESGTIETVFRAVPQATGGALKEDGDSEMDLVILEKETIICGVEEGDVIVYAYYKIGWA